FYLDSTPTHSYMKYLYKYPQGAYPYSDLVETNRRRGRLAFEYELIDTGVFDQDRYFDLFVEYAKASPEDILVQITAWNRGPQTAALHVLPTLWFRNYWSWDGEAHRPLLRASANVNSQPDLTLIEAVHDQLGTRYLYCEGAPALLFTENETNTKRIFGVANRTPYVKDGINNYLVHGQRDAVNSTLVGTKAAPHYAVSVNPGGSCTIRLRLTDRTFDKGVPFGATFDEVLVQRRREADEFYAAITPPSLGPDG